MLPKEPNYTDLNVLQDILDSKEFCQLIYDKEKNSLSHTIISNATVEYYGLIEKLFNLRSNQVFKKENNEKNLFFAYICPMSGCFLCTYKFG